MDGAHQDRWRMEMEEARLRAMPVAPRPKRPHLGERGAASPKFALMVAMVASALFGVGE